MQKGEGVPRTQIHLEECVHAQVRDQACVHHQVQRGEGEGVQTKVRQGVQDRASYMREDQDSLISQVLPETVVHSICDYRQR